MSRKGSVYVLVLILLLSSLVSAQEKPDNYNKYQSLTLTFDIEADMDLTLTDSQGKLTEMIVDLSFFPRENQFQTIQNIDYISSPPAQVSATDKYTTYTWKNIGYNEKLIFGISSTIKTNNYRPLITSEMSFPLKDIDVQYLKYTKPSEFIDITPPIEQQTQQIIAGETDLMTAIFKIADWTKGNIEYDLTTLTANAVQKSSWVLTNRQGVCDEMTNLFISMVRSIGIPAQFVSGMVYSNIDYEWGPHGWAEVYIPQYGWVPFDVTFGQYGWLDPSHIKLKDDTDSGSPSAEYSWKSLGIDVDIGEASLETQFVSAGSEIETFLNVDLDVHKKAVSQGSYIPLYVTIENTKNNYIIPSLVITKAPGLLGSNAKQTIIKPKETKTIAWIIEVPDDIDKDFIYTSIIEVKTTFGNTAETKLKYSSEYDYFSLQTAQDIVNNLEQQAEKKSLDTVSFSCTPDQTKYYENDPVTITCSVSSTETSSIQLKGCIKENCQDMKLLPKTPQTITFTFDAEEAGRYTATLEDQQNIVYTFFSLDITKIPELSISNINSEETSCLGETRYWKET